MSLVASSFIALAKWQRAPVPSASSKLDGKVLLRALICTEFDLRS
jgi:hypothetical protein